MTLPASNGKTADHFNSAVVATPSKTQCAALFQAARGGDFEFIAEYVDHWQGQHLEVVDEEGYTPLMLAAWQGHLDVTEFLIESGANVQAKTDFGVTALMAACETGQEKVVAVLLGAGVDIDAITNMGIEATNIAGSKRLTGIVDMIEAARAKRAAQDEIDAKAALAEKLRGYTEGTAQDLRPVPPLRFKRGAS